MVQRTLYEAKQVRTDTLTAVEADQAKLEHLLGYFKNTVAKMLNIAGDVLMQVMHS